MKHIATGIMAVSAIGALMYAGSSSKDRTFPPVGWGVANSAITQSNIQDTVCNPHWSTSSIRPSSSYTTALKIKQLKEMGYTDLKTADDEEDHIISLELGGSPTDPKNLWPEPYAGELGARQKDKVENYLHRQVCANKMTLEEAQKEISTDWVAVYRQNKL